MRIVKRLRKLLGLMTVGPFAVDPDLRDGGVDQLIEMASGKQLTVAFGTSDGNTQDLYGAAAALNLAPVMLDLLEASDDVVDLVKSHVACGCRDGVACEVCRFVRVVNELREKK